VTPDDRTPLERLTDAVEMLTRPRRHRQSLMPDDQPRDARTGKPIIGAHFTQVASLLDQLQACLEPGGTADAGCRVPGSQPAARLEAIDALLLIDTESSQWVGLLAVKDRGTVAGNLHALVGAAPELDDRNLTDLAKNAGRWESIAAVITGWEVPSWRPYSTCPLCATRGSLRVRIGEGVHTAHGTCVSCWEHWTPETIGVLVEHIRWENGDVDQATA
jgi:hypothetical protein